MEEVLSGLPLAFSPLVEVWLEKALVELSHAPKGSSSVEEVELFVIFFVHLSVITLHLFT